MIFGYIRTTKSDSNQDQQFDELKKAGCEKIFHDEQLFDLKSMPELNSLLSQLSEGDIVTVWKIDRLGRSIIELLKLMSEWRKLGVDFRSISDGVDTTTNLGQIWYVLSSIYLENEKELSLENSSEMLKSTRVRGRIGGRHKGLTPRSKEIARLAASLYNSKNFTTKEICTRLDIGSKATLYSYLRHEGIKIEGWTRSPKRINS